MRKSKILSFILLNQSNLCRKCNQSVSGNNHTKLMRAANFYSTCIKRQSMGKEDATESFS